MKNISIKISKRVARFVDKLPPEYLDVATTMHDFSILLALAFLFLALSGKAHGQTQLSGSGDLSGKWSVNFAAVGYLIQEDCEGTGTPAGWNNLGSPDWDYTVSPLAGTQSLNLPALTTGSTNDWGSNQNTIYGYIMARFGATPASTRPIIIIQDSTGATIGAIRQKNTAFIDITHGANGSSNLGITPGTDYHIWWDYTIGTGTDGVCNLYLSTTSTKPGSPDRTVSNGTGTTAPRRLKLLGQENGVVLDKIRVSTSNIGSNPP